MERTGDGAAPSRVLLIEGDAPLRRFLAMLLEEAGYEVTAAEDGNAALTHLGASPFACVILGSPVALRVGDDRSTVLEQIERLSPALAERLIVVTSHLAERPLLRRAMRMHVHAIFGKPFDVAVLVQVVRDCVAGRTPARRFHAIPPPVIRKICEAESLSETW